MRWPWQTPPGVVRVNHKRLIELQRNALHAADLEAESRVLTREAQLMEAQAQASVLLAERRQQFGVDVAPEVRAEVTAALPLTTEGALHEAAFLAFVEDRVWAQRSPALAALTSTNHRDDRA